MSALNYGEALRYQREIVGLSQFELAKQIGTSHQNINRWERGAVLPNIDFCFHLANFYGITVDELFCVSDYPKVTDTTSFGTAHYSSEERELIKKYRELNALGKKLVDTIIDTHLATMAESKQSKKS